MRFHKRVTLVGIENICIGSHARNNPDVILLATGPLTIGCYSHIAYGTRMYTIGDDYSGAHLMGPTIPGEFLSLTQVTRVAPPLLFFVHLVSATASLLLLVEFVKGLFYRFSG